MIYINRNDKAKNYIDKYGHIPKGNNERLWWLIDSMKLSPSKMQSIIKKETNMKMFLTYYDYKIILYEDPEGAKRPRFRLINTKNYMSAAKSSEFIHVYSPNAAEDHNYMHRLVDSELDNLFQFIQTPCRICINTYSKTPSYFSNSDVILAEIGLHRPITKPDWDNIGKKYSDMFNANVWLDDQMVQDGEVHKYFSILPRVEIFVRYLNFVTNKKQYDQITNRSDYRENYSISYLNGNGEPVIHD